MPILLLLASLILASYSQIACALPEGPFETIHSSGTPRGPQWSLIRDAQKNHYLHRREFGVEELIPLEESKDGESGFPGWQHTFRARVEAPDARTGQLKFFHFRVNYSELQPDRSPPERSLRVDISEGLFSWHFDSGSAAVSAPVVLEAKNFEQCLNLGARDDWQICFESKPIAVTKGIGTIKAQDLEAYIVGPNVSYKVAGSLKGPQLKVARRSGEFGRKFHFSTNNSANDGIVPMGNVFGAQKLWKDLIISFDKETGAAVATSNLKIPVLVDVAPAGPQYSVISSRSILRAEILPSDLGEHRSTSVDQRLGLSITTYDLTKRARKETPFVRALLVQTRNSNYLVGLLDKENKKAKAKRFVGELISYNLPLQGFVRQEFEYYEGEPPTLKVVDLFDYNRQAPAMNLFKKRYLPLNPKEGRLNSQVDAALGIVERDTYCAAWTPTTTEIICLIRKESEWLFYVGNPQTQNYQLFPLEADRFDSKEEIYQVKARHLWLNLGRMQLMSVDSPTSEVRFRIVERKGAAVVLEIFNTRSDVEKGRGASNPSKSSSPRFILEAGKLSQLSLCEEAVLSAAAHD